MTTTKTRVHEELSANCVRRQVTPTQAATVAKMAKAFTKGLHAQTQKQYEITPEIQALLNSVNTTNEYITPHTAEQYLKVNAGNRPFKPKAIRKYARRILEGKWELTGESIKFSTSGKLVDGQNRLKAVVTCGRPIVTSVTRGIKDGTFIVLDSGTKRSSSDNVFVAFPELNTTQSQMASGAAILLHTYSVGNPVSTLNKHQLSDLEIVSILSGHRGLVDLANKSVRSRGEIFLLLHREELFLRYVLTKKDAGAAEQFLLALQRGINLSLTDALYHLRRLANTGKHDPKLYLPTAVRIWNAQRKGKELSLSTVGNILRQDSPSYQLIPEIL